MKRKKEGLSIVYLLVPLVFIFLVVLVYQILTLTSFNYSMDIIHFVLLSNSKFSLISISFLLLFFIYFIFQEKIQFDFMHSENFAVQSVKTLRSKRKNYLSIYSDGRTKLNRKNIQYLIKDIPRHGYLNYTNRNSLTKEYFKLSKQSISNETNLYLVLSETGSPASEILSLFTHKEYNHISLSFDRSLYTMISYNGGNGYQQPGLNTESLSSLNQKENSRLLVYSLKVDKENRIKILNRIEQINREGSAYNVLGLLTNVSVRSNMMYCSQFAYEMLEEIDQNFFLPSQDKIKPTDFIEYDDKKQLTFEYKINFSKNKEQVIS